MGELGSSVYDEFVEPAEVSENWQDEAECLGAPTELFFPYGTERMMELSRDRAKRICGQCAVRAACLEYALENRIKDGIWGGWDESERRGVIRRRRKVANHLMSQD